jgi:hypothetical protein
MDCRTDDPRLVFDGPPRTDGFRIAFHRTASRPSTTGRRTDRLPRIDHGPLLPAVRLEVLLACHRWYVTIRRWLGTLEHLCPHHSSPPMSPRSLDPRPSATNGTWPPMALRPPMTSTPDTSAAHGTSDTNDNSVCLRPRCPGRVRRRRRPPGCPQRVCEAHAIGLEVLATPWGTHCTRVERWPTAGERSGALVAYAHSWAAPPRSWQGFDTPRERAAHSWSTAPHPPIPPPRPHITPRRGSCRDPLNSRLRGHTHWVGLQRACLVGCVRVSLWRCKSGGTARGERAPRCVDDGNLSWSDRNRPGG